VPIYEYACRSCGHAFERLVLPPATTAEVAVLRKYYIRSDAGSANVAWTQRTGTQPPRRILAHAVPPPPFMVRHGAPPVHGELQDS
jgi:hypothetical protein